MLQANSTMRLFFTAEFHYEVSFQRGPQPSATRSICLFKQSSEVKVMPPELVNRVSSTVCSFERQAHLVMLVPLLVHFVSSSSEAHLEQHRVLPGLRQHSISSPFFVKVELLEVNVYYEHVSHCVFHAAGTVVNDFHLWNHMLWCRAGIRSSPVAAQRSASSRAFAPCSLRRPLEPARDALAAGARLALAGRGVGEREGEGTGTRCWRDDLLAAAGARGCLGGRW